MKNEIEIKCEIISESDFIKIKNYLGNYKTVLIQENIYYDTNDMFLQKQQAVFRLRIENGANIYTLKSKAKFKDGVMQANENEMIVSTAELSKYSVESYFIKLYSDTIPDNFVLMEQGRLNNKRLVYDFYDVQLELDCFVIFDHTFYEIEIECNNTNYYIEKLKLMLSELQIEFVPSISKYKRFLNLKNKLKV